MLLREPAIDREEGRLAEGARLVGGVEGPCLGQGGRGIVQIQ